MSTGGSFEGSARPRTLDGIWRLAIVALVLAAVESACAPRSETAAHASTVQSSSSSPTLPSDDAKDADRGNDGDSGDAAAETSNEPCPPDMVLVEIATPPRRSCIDKYEASLIEVMADGSEPPYPHYLPVDGHDVRAVSRPHVFPQGYISEVQAQDACNASNKRLCDHEEWKAACMGPGHTTFPYGTTRRPSACHDTGRSAVVAVFGAKAVAASTPAATGKRAHVTKRRASQVTRPRGGAPPKPPAKAAPRKGARGPAKKSERPSTVDPGVWAKLNDPRLGQVDGALAKTGEHAECVNELGAFDMVGNLHEWVATDPALPHGTFAGGYYLDTAQNGDGCLYKTQAHAHDYHDYSTGFRCCAGVQ